MTERNNVACPVADEITIRQPQVTKLAKKYMSTELGEIDVLSENGQILFDFGEWKAQWLRGRMMMGPLGSSRSTDPTNQGFEFVVGDKAGKRTLTIRDGQHEYVLQKWLEADQTPAGTGLYPISRIFTAFL